MKGRRGDVFYLVMILIVVAAGWLGSRYLGSGTDKPFDESRLAHILVDIEIAPIELTEISFGFFRPSKQYAPIKAQVRYADDMEVALVTNRNQLLLTPTRIE